MSGSAETSVRPARKRAAASPAKLDRGELEKILGFLLRRAMVKADQVYTEHMASTGYSPHHYAILIVVEQNPGCRISDLARAIGISPTNIVPALDELMERGVIFRDFSSKDRREKRLNVTERGVETLAKLRARHRTVSDQMVAKLGREKVDQLIALLRELGPEY